MFKSFEYYVILFLVVVLYYSTPKKYGKYILLLSSYAVYVYWEPRLFYVLIIETIIFYFAALYWQPDATLKKNIWQIPAAIITVFAILFYFKYQPPVITSQGGVEKYSFVDLLRPLGISFFTFQGVGYLIDVKRGRINAYKNFFDIALFIAFFPQLIAGPIERARKLMPQLSRFNEMKYENFSKGLFYVAYGLWMKIFVADNLGAYVSGALYSGIDYNGYIILIGSAFWALQLYADFASYSLIAIGSAAFFGIHLSENFKRPFMAGSPMAIWRRWHMTLMQWLRDYVYLTIAKRETRYKAMFKIFGTFAVFIFFAIWHGLKISLVYFGLIQFVIVIFEANILNKFSHHKIVYKLSKFLLLVFGFMFLPFFYAIDMSHVTHIYELMGNMNAKGQFLPYGIGYYNFAISIFAICMLLFLDVVQEKNNQTLYQFTRKMSYTKKCLYYIIFIILVIMFGEFQGGAFYYARF